MNFPIGPDISEIIEADLEIGWPRFKVWSADRYIELLADRTESESGVTRAAGVEMALDGALASLSGAFDSSVALLIRGIEDECQPDKRVPEHLLGTRQLSDVYEANEFVLKRALGPLVSEILECLVGQGDDVPVGWIAVLRRMRNRPVHRGSLARAWDIGADGLPSVATLLDVPGQDVLDYLKAQADSMADLTNRVIAAANSLGMAAALAPSSRVAWHNGQA